MTSAAFSGAHLLRLVISSLPSSQNSWKEMVKTLHSLFTNSFSFFSSSSYPGNSSSSSTIIIAVILTLIYSSKANFLLPRTVINCASPSQVSTFDSISPFCMGKGSYSFKKALSAGILTPLFSHEPPLFQAEPPPVEELPDSYLIRVGSVMAALTSFTGSDCPFTQYVY